MTPRPPVAVVICSRDRAQLLEQSLDAIRRELREGDELVVVDSASVTGDVRAVAAAAGATAVRCDVPGLGLARNYGWPATRSDVVVFTDDDCVPEPGWLDAAAAALSEPGVGVVWGRVVASGGTGVALSTTEEHHPVEGSLSGDLTTLGHGANMAFRREVLDRLGGFDPMLGVGSRLAAGEDKDAFWRAMREGWRVRLAPDMAIGHVQWRDDGAAVRQMFRYGVGAGAVAAKRRRLAGERGLVRHELWRHGALPLRYAMQRRDRVAAAAAVWRAAGVVVGRWRAGRLPLDGTVFSAPARR